MKFGLKLNTKFKPDVVLKKAERAARRFAYRAGGLVLTIGKRKLKPRKQKKVSELNESEREDYERKKKVAKAQGKPRPKRPMLPSEPGEPPRLKDTKSPLKKEMKFAVDSNNNAVIGARRARTGIAGVLEHGGTSNGKTILPRPWVGPSLEEAAPKLDDFWENSVSR